MLQPFSKPYVLNLELNPAVEITYPLGGTVSLSYLAWLTVLNTVLKMSSAQSRLIFSCLWCHVFLMFCSKAFVELASYLQQDLDAEFTAARLLISKMKGEVLGVIDKAKEAETNLTDQHKIIEQKEKEILEFRNITVLQLFLVEAQCRLQSYVRIKRG